MATGLGVSSAYFGIKKVTSWAVYRRYVAPELSFGGLGAPESAIESAALPGLDRGVDAYA